MLRYNSTPPPLPLWEQVLPTWYWVVRCPYRTLVQHAHFALLCSYLSLLSVATMAVAAWLQVRPFKVVALRVSLPLSPSL